MRYIDVRTNPEYKYDEVIGDINYNFSLCFSYSGGTITGDTNFTGALMSGGTNLYDIFSTGGGSTTGDFLPLSGGTVTGNTQVTATLTANTINAGVMQSGGTNLYAIFALAGSGGGTSADLWSAGTGSNSIIQNNGLSNEATGNQSVAFGTGALASGYLANVLGGYQNSAIGTYSSAINGTYNISSGQSSSVLGGDSNYSDGQGSAVIGGQLNRASGQHSVLVGGRINRASGQRSVVIGGTGITRTTDDSIFTPNAYLAHVAGTKIYSGGTALENIFASANTFTTGTTLVGTSALFSRNDGATYNLQLSGLTSGITEIISSYLNLSGGTVTGDTIFSSGLTATTIFTENYIDFKTGTTDPSAIAGRVYFDQGDNALSYFPITPAMDVTINIGQESLVHVKNNSGSLITNGSAVHINGSFSGIPTIVLADASQTEESFVSGVATHDIASGDEGFITNFGIVRGLTLTGDNVGNSIYLSDTNPGQFIFSPPLTLTSRISHIGRVITTGTTTASILVNIDNEETADYLTANERNLVAIDSLSTGLHLFTGLTKTSSTTFSVGPVDGWIVKNTGDYAFSGEVYYISYTGTTGTTTPYLTTADSTYVLISSASTLITQPTFPTQAERRNNIFLGRVNHPDRTQINFTLNSPDYNVSPISQLRDMMNPIGLINSGVIVSANGTNLNFNNSSGHLYGLGISWISDNLQPNSVSISASTPVSFEYRTQTGGTFSATTSIIPGTYDVNGVATAIPGGSNVSTNQRVFVYPNGEFRVQFGQTTYSSLANAIVGVDSETFVVYPNLGQNAVLTGIISVRKGATDLSSANDAKFISVSKFGEIFGGTGGISTTTLQQAYNNSTTPEITTDSTNGAVSIQAGTGLDSNNVFETRNSSSIVTSFIKGTGDASFSGLTSTTFNSGVLMSGGTNLYDIFSTGGGSATGNFLPLSGGTVTGNTQITATLTATTITAGTIYGGVLMSGGTNLYDIFSTGGGGSLTGAYLNLSGGTVTGNTIIQSNFTVTGSTSLSSVTFSYGSASTIDAAAILSAGTNIETIFVTPNTTQTLTNKRITKRIVVVPTSATPTLNTDTCDIARLTGLTSNVTNFSTNLTGTPDHGDMFSYEITDNGVARTLSWGASFGASGTLALPTTTVISTLLKVLFQYNSASGLWVIAAVV